MRNTHTILLLAMPLLLAAQQGETQTHDLYQRAPFIPEARHDHAAAKAVRSDAASLWSEDFESGLNGWSVETSFGAVDWTITTTGNTGGYTPGPLESSTGYPGGHWIMADSDGDGMPGQPENTTMTSPVITGFDTVPYMLLRFEQSFRQLNNDQTLVEVTGNGGADWTVYEVNQHIAGNQSTPGAPASETIMLNITSALANGSSAIQVRFRWASYEGYTYSWQVDDIALIGVKPNDLVLHEATWASWNLDAPGYEGIPCTIYPVGETHELKFKGVIGNNGSLPQTNVRLQVDVTGPDGYSATLSSASIDLQPGSVDSLFIEDYQPPDVVGDYGFHIAVVQDQTDDQPTDNSMDQGIKVDAHLFARDEGSVQSVRANGGYDYVFGNRFWIEEYGRTMEGVDVALGPGTEAGAVISALVYDGNFHYVAQSDLHTVTSEEVNEIGGDHFITLPLTEPTLLEGERLYLACVYVQTISGEAYAGMSGTSLPQTSLIYRYDTDHWYYTTSTPMVRMRLGGITGVDDLSRSVPPLQAWPSPFEGEATASFVSEHGGPARWDLRDATGRLVRTGNLGTVPPGERRFTVDGADLADGLYTLSLEIDGVRSALGLVHQARR